MANKRYSAAGNIVPLPDLMNDIDTEEYANVARCARLLSIQLIASNFKIEPDFFEENANDKMKLNFEDLHESYDEENRVATGIFRFEAIRKRANRKIFSLRDEFIVAYYIPSDCDTLHGKAFAANVGLIAAYPYFRAHVASTASLADADMPVLPIISRGPFKKKGTELIPSDAAAD